MPSNFRINTKSITLYLTIVFIFAILFCLWRNDSNSIENRSDLSITLSLVKDVNPSLISEINKDIAICYKPRRWENETCTMFLTRCDDSTFCLKTNIEPIQDVHEWSLIEFKNIGPDKIILLGGPSGDIFSSWYILGRGNKIFMNDLTDWHTDNDSRIQIEDLPCPITLESQHSYYEIARGPHPLQKTPAMEQFMYYKPITDSVYKYWLTMPEKKITNNPLELLEKYRDKIMPKDYIISRSILTSTYIDSKYIKYQDSLVKSWIND